MQTTLFSYLPIQKFPATYHKIYFARDIFMRRKKRANVRKKRNKGKEKIKDQKKKCSETGKEYARKKRKERKESFISFRDIYKKDLFFIVKISSIFFLCFISHAVTSIYVVGSFRDEPSKKYNDGFLGDNFLSYEDRFIEKRPRFETAAIDDNRESLHSKKKIPENSQSDTVFSSKSKNEIEVIQDDLAQMKKSSDGGENSSVSEDREKNLFDLFGQDVLADDRGASEEYQNTKTSQSSQTILRSSKPTRIELPSVGILLPLFDGAYDFTKDEWTIASDRAYFAMPSVYPNEIGGNTVIYGHNYPNVFGKTVNLLVNDRAYISTIEGWVFVYEYITDEYVSPKNASIFDYQGSPQMTIITCAGEHDELRRLIKFRLFAVE